MHKNDPEKCEHWEALVLASVKEANNVAFATLEEKQRAKKRKTETNVHQLEEIVDIMDSDEE